MDNIKGKTVLILGNGFDLAHYLPTRYSDFMDFCKEIANYCHVFKDNSKAKIECFRKIQTQYNISENTIREIDNLINDNIWYNYLNRIIERKKIIGENWIDFECEIKNIIEPIEKNLKSDDHINKIKTEEIIPMDFFKAIEPNNPLVRKLNLMLLSDLNRITRALEIYLSEYEEKLYVKKYSLDIKKINPDYIINFNYTHTFEKVYSECKTTVFHIHGECDSNRAFEHNNMVLGIDEYWSNEEGKLHTDFTLFKKFAQRIIKRTGIENHKYFKEIKKIYSYGLHPCHTLSRIYIFGHSLDVTDKDILFDFLNSKATDVTIFYHDEVAEGQLLSNVIKLIGEKRLLKKISQSKLKFIHQADMVERTDIHEADSHDLAGV